MKTFLISILFAAFAAVGVPASAAPEAHEEFARQYMPESQAVFERFRKDCAETQTLRESLAEDLRVMNRFLGEDVCFIALSEKIKELEYREFKWATLLRDAFFKHKAGMTTSEQLAADDQTLAKKSIEWENDVLKNFLKNFLARCDAIVPVTVKIPGKDYAFGKYEVTQEEYQAVMGRNPSEFKGANRPVESVSWYDAVKFCKKLTERERAAGRISSKQEYRLPTSEEWEHAFLAGMTKEHFFRQSHTAAPYRASSASLGGGWVGERMATLAVGQMRPNAFGLYDMFGNVKEWTSTSEDSKDRKTYGCAYSTASRHAEDAYDVLLDGIGEDASKEFSNTGFRIVLETL